ncbi:MAG: NUDIX hydrolase [Chloroflexi bacterium]|nr:NUDIX hydrolase [Chloroflexota bacterium]
MQAQIPATCVAAVIVTDGRVLLGRRAPSRTYYPDCWDLFGGHVEENESLVGALRRELREELGLEIKSWRPLAVVHDPIEPSDIHMFIITDWVGQPRNTAPDEQTEIGWFWASDLPEFGGLDEYRRVVEKAMRDIADV